VVVMATIPTASQTGPEKGWECHKSEGGAHTHIRTHTYIHTCWGRDSNEWLTLHAN